MASRGPPAGQLRLVVTLVTQQQLESTIDLPVASRSQVTRHVAHSHGPNVGLGATSSADALVVKVLTFDEQWIDLTDHQVRLLSLHDALYVFPPGTPALVPPMLSSTSPAALDVSQEEPHLISPKSNSSPQAVFDLLKVVDPVTRVRYLPEHLLVHALQLCGLNPTHGTVAEMASAADTDQNGQIEVHEFLLYCETLQYTRPDRDSLRETFRHFDLDGNGYLDRDEFAQLLRAEGEPLSDDEVAVALTIADANGDGRIDLEEFVRLLCDTRFDLQSSSTVSPAPIPESPETLQKHDELSNRLEASRQRAAANHRRRVQEQTAAQRADSGRADTNRQADAPAPAKAGSSGGCCLVA